MGMEPSAIAEALFKIASREECVPLRLPLGAVSWKMSKSKFQTLLEEFDAVKDISAMGEQLWYSLSLFLSTLRPFAEAGFD